MAVVSTHGHLDHLGGNTLLREAQPNVRVIASNAVAPALQGWLVERRRNMLDFIASGRANAASAARLQIDIALIERGLQLLPDTALGGPGETRANARPLQIGFVRHAVTAADL